MKTHRTPGQLWADVFDYLAPALRLSPYDVAVYMYLLQRTRLRGLRTIAITAAELGRALCRSAMSACLYLRQLIRKGCIAASRCRGRGKGKGITRTLTVFLPEEIFAARAGAAPLPRGEEYLKASLNRALRIRVYRREGGRCFYCRRRIALKEMWLDHVLATSRGGSRGADNVVASCQTCNRSKQTRPAEEFLRLLRERRRISARQLRTQLAKLALFRRGKLPLAA